jgi:hypothetical protein
MAGTQSGYISNSPGDPVIFGCAVIRSQAARIALPFATDQAESTDADIEMTRHKAFPAILRLRDRSYRKPIE